MTDTTLPSGTAEAFSRSTQPETEAAGSGEGLFAVRDQIPDWSADCVEHIARLCKLEANWDSYGASPVDPRSITIAKQLVRVLSQVSGIDRPRIAASPAGVVALSWEWEDHSRELDLEILWDGTLRYSYLDERDSNQDCEGETRFPNRIAHLLTKW